MQPAGPSQANAPIELLCYQLVVPFAKCKSLAVDTLLDTLDCWLLAAVIAD